MNKVHLTDCMEFMKDLPDNSYELAIVDPPYAHNSGNAFTSRLKKYGDLSFNDKKPEPEYFTELMRTSKNQIIWGGNYFIEWLGNTKCIITWWKHQPVKTYAQTEIAWTSFQDLHSNIFDYQYYGNINTDPDGRSHPNQKPIALYKWPLQNYAKPGDKIFDSHVGSGSIRIACHDMGFDFEGCEIDRDYWEAQEKRYQNHIKQNDLFGDKEIQDLIYEPRV